MALFKFLPLLLLSLVLLHLVEARLDQFEESNDHHLGISRIGAHRSLLESTGIDCGAACEARCRLSSRPRLCERACGTCCYRCKCVPPGTSGNYDSCSCYANITTHGGRRKCP